MESHNNGPAGMWPLNRSRQNSESSAGEKQQRRPTKCPSLVGDGTKVNVLVTGGAGYVGSHTLVSLLDQDFVSDVIVVDNLCSTDTRPDGKPECLKRVEQLTGKRLIFYNVDVIEAQPLDAIFQQHRIDCVIHLAALKAVGDSCQRPLDYYRNNVGGTINLLQVMSRCRVKKMVFSSSATCYGQPSYLPVDESHPTGQNCSSPYGRTKYFVEEILRDLCTSDPEWSVICLRYFNPVGAHPSGEIGEDPVGVPSNLMPFVAQVAIGRRPQLLVFGNDYPTADRTGVRDYIHIMDLAEGHVAATKRIMSAKPLACRAYNLGQGKGHSVLEVVRCFERVSGKPIAVKFVQRREGDVAVSFSDCSLAARELHWRAKRNLHDMCADMWRWQCQNPKGYTIAKK